MRAESASIGPMAFTPARKHLFYTELAKLLEAGFGIRAAASVMRETRLPADQAGLLARMDAALESGRTISAAFGEASPEITGLEKSIVAAGERGGKLAVAFQHLAGYFGMLAAARREMISALVYPLVLLHLGLFVAVVPGALIAGEKTFGAILRDFAVALLIAYAAGIAAAFAVRAVMKAAERNAAPDRSLSRLPVLGKARRSMAMARFTRVWHIGVLAGLPVVETARMAGEASRSGGIGKASRDLAAAAEAGEALGPRMLAADAIPREFARAYAIAEETGGLDKDLARWAGIFEDEARRGMQAVSAVLPKLAYFLIVAFIAWKLISFYSGYYGMLEELSE